MCQSDSRNEVKEIKAQVAAQVEENNGAKKSTNEEPGA